MKARTPEVFLSCHRPGQPSCKSVQKGLQLAENDSLLRERLRVQAQFDEAIMGIIGKIEPPENFLQTIEELTEAASGGKRRSLLLHPAILSVVAGALFLVGFVVWMEMERRGQFPGQEAVAHLIGVAREMSGVELQPTSAQAGDLGDAFYMRGFEGFSLIPELARMQAVGSRVFRQSGHLVAQLAVDPHNALVYVFRATDFGVELARSGQWVILEQEQSVAAIRQDQGLCSVITFRGSREDMQKFLQTLTR